MSLSQTTATLSPIVPPVLIVAALAMAELAFVPVPDLAPAAKPVRVRIRAATVTDSYLPPGHIILYTICRAVKAGSLPPR